MTDKWYCGVDIGGNGAIAFVNKDCTKYFDLRFNPNEEKDLINELYNYKDDIVMCVVEQVHSMPGQGVSSSFKFGNNAGWWRGVLMSLNIPFEYATPQKWQKELSCLTKGDKNITKQKASEMFPNVKIIHATADAYLIAKYCRNKNM